MSAGFSFSTPPPTPASLGSGEMSNLIRRNQGQGGGRGGEPSGHHDGWFPFRAAYAWDKDRWSIGSDPLLEGSTAGEAAPSKRQHRGRDPPGEIFAGLPPPPRLAAGPEAGRFLARPRPLCPPTFAKDIGFLLPASAATSSPHRQLVRPPGPPLGSRLMGHPPGSLARRSPGPAGAAGGFPPGSSAGREGPAAEATFEWLKVERNPPRKNSDVGFGKKARPTFPCFSTPTPNFRDPAGRERDRKERSCCRLTGNWLL